MLKLNFNSLLKRNKSTTTGKKKRVVILGSGWGSFRLQKNIDKSKYEVIVVSPRNHFLFTPLLASTTVGTLDFRSVIEDVRSYKDETHFYQSICEEVNFNAKQIRCVEKNSVYGEGGDRKRFNLDYDILAIGVGAKNNTFHVPGVEKYAFFLKELNDAREIRGRIIEIFEKASLPVRTIEEKRDLLHFVIVGAGPTGIEFAAEFSDFFWEDVAKYFPDLPVNEVKITILEASHTILSSFDEKLVKRAVSSITKSGVYIRTDSIVKEVKQNSVVLNDGSEIKCGMVIWSTGVGPRALVQKLDVPKTKQGRIIVDENLNLVELEDKSVFAFGDCAADKDEPLTCTAQVAVQQGKYLARKLNSDTDIGPFHFKFKGLMLYTGKKKAALDSPWFIGYGFFCWILWRSVYLTNLMSIKNRLQVPLEWLRTIVLGRDVASFGNTNRHRFLQENADKDKEIDRSIE